MLAGEAPVGYPFDRTPTTFDQWTFVLVIVLLDHRSMENQAGALFTQGSLRWTRRGSVSL
jgi:hypothetical protein